MKPEDSVNIWRQNLVYHYLVQSKGFNSVKLIKGASLTHHHSVQAVIFQVRIPQVLDISVISVWLPRNSSNIFDDMEIDNLAVIVAKHQLI